MKRGCMLVLMLALCALCSCALAFDLSPYEVGSGDILLACRQAAQHTAAVERTEDRQELAVYDVHGQPLYRRALGGVQGYDAAEVADHPDGGCLVLLVLRTAGSDGNMCLLRISADGALLWETHIPKGFAYNWTVLCGDGAGGAFFAFADLQNYKAPQVWHFDAQGNVRWNRVLEAEGLIFSGFTGRFDAQRDRLIVAGHAVSKSKGIYDAAVVEIDREGNLAVAQAKDFSCRLDYGFDVLMDGEGRFYAHSRAGYLNTSGTPHVLVPLDALPDAAMRAIVLRGEEAPKTYYYNAEGGRKYHAAARCGSIDAKYYGSIREVSADELGKGALEKLVPCTYCGADRFALSPGG